MSSKVVHVEWLDSQSSNGWLDADEIERELDLTHTIGILIDQTEGFIVVAHSKDPQTNSYNGVITIPRQAVEKIRTICRVKV